MLDWLRYRYELAKLKKQNAQQLAPLDDAYFTARRAKKPRDEMNPLWEKLLDEHGVNRDRIALLETNYLTEQAQKCLLPIPAPQDATVLGEPGDTSDRWRRSENCYELLLSEEGLRELRLALRADRRERLEIVRSWVATIVPGLTGLIGVLIGLAAIILGRR
jgi:hypothetical protein